MSEKRVITEQQEQAYRLVSHDFECLTVEQAAERMGITPSAVSQLLKRVEAVAPQLFPLLTKREKDTLDMLENNFTVEQIATTHGVTERQVRNVVASLIEKKKWGSGPGPKTVSYSPEMEKHIVRRF